MDTTTFDKYLQERYYDQMKYYESASLKNQKKYRLFQWILIILSALAPVLAALNAINPGTDKTVTVISSVTVVIISSIVAILTTGLKTFNYLELWVNYRSTYEKLKPEIYYYNFNIGPYGAPDIDKESLFVTRVEAMLDAEHSQWPPATKSQENQDRSTETNHVTSSQRTIARNDAAGGATVSGTTHE
ncbi:MAG: DUF4231 domain-containing protein [Ferruginibacter sp.]